MDAWAVAADDVRSWREALLATPGPRGGSVGDDADRVDLIAELERIKSAACAVQADLAAALDDSTRAREAADGVPAARRGRGVAAQVALARQVSPHRGRVLLGLARDLRTDLPRTRDALRHGRLDEHRALVVAAETGCLDREGRAAVDDAVCGPRGPLDGLGTQRLTAEVRRQVCAADPAAVARRSRRAETERHVRLRPAPDAMAYLTALLPVGQGVAAYAALSRDAATARASTEAGVRSRGQVMADLLVERVTGQSTAGAVPVSVDLVVSDATLLGAGSEPGELPGHGPVPAQVARELVACSLDHEATWLRRLYADPAGQLVALSSRRRFAADGLAALLRVRDQGLCRTPWCDAPARHDDHVVPAAEGGATEAANTQGLCEACNYAKQAPGWRAAEVPGARHTVRTTTPTGHRYRSRAPAPPTPARPAARSRPLLVDVVRPSPVESHLLGLLVGAVFSDGGADGLGYRGDGAGRARTRTAMMPTRASAT